MKYPEILGIDDVLHQLNSFDAIIDARSPSEYALDHLPGAINAPVLDDEQRIRVGTMYKQVNSFEAKKVGAALRFKVVCGTTGSGKSRLLEVLHAHGAQVLDLEQLAAHRGSVLGNLPSQPQPSQKAFETSIWDTLRRFDPALPVFVESESKKVGNLRVPTALMESMRASDCISLTLSRANRMRLLMEDYQHFLVSPASLNEQLEHLTALHGRETIARWQSMSDGGQMAPLVEELLERHYDPAYLRSIDRNFVKFGEATVLELDDIDTAAFDKAAASLIASAQ